MTATADTNTLFKALRDQISEENFEAVSATCDKCGARHCAAGGRGSHGFAYSAVLALLPSDADVLRCKCAALLQVLVLNPFGSCSHFRARVAEL